MDALILADLAKSGLTPSDIGATELEPNGLSPSLSYRIPYFLPDGTPHPTMYRIRNLSPTAEHRYTSPPNSGVVPYWPRLAKKGWNDAKELKHKFIVEGEKKAVCFTKYMKLPAVGIGGCWMWHSGDSRHGHVLHPQIKSFLNPGDIVDILLDGDIVSNSNVEYAGGELREVLLDMGCVPQFILLPNEMGFDDWAATLKFSELRKAYEELPKLDATGLRIIPEVLARRAGVQLNADGGFVRNDRNIRKMMQHDKYFRKYWYDQSRNETFTGTTSMTDALGQQFIDDVQHRLHPRATKQMVEGLITSLPALPEFCRHPLKDYLNAVQWDGVARLDEMLISYFGADDNGYVRAVSSNWLIGAVARIFEPGCQNDTMVILEGPQGIGKTTAFTILAGDYHVETSIDHNLKDFQMKIGMAWFLDIMELSGMNNADMDATKGILSTKVDTYRVPFGRTMERHPRKCIIVGSTNSDTYLRDVTGNRRYMPIKCGMRVSLERLKNDRNQPWAEAVARYKKGESWHVVPEDMAREQQLARMQLDPWTDVVANYIERKERLSRVRCDATIRYGVTTNEIMSAMQIETKDMGAMAKKRVANILKHFGWIHAQIRTQNILGFEEANPGIENTKPWMYLSPEAAKLEHHVAPPPNKLKVIK